MKKFVFLLLTTCLASATYAQGIDLGVKAGANFSSITEADNVNNRTGFVGGVFLGLKFNDKIALQPELLYSQQGAEFDAEEINLDYVTVPVILKYYLIDGLNVQVGPQFGFVADDGVPEEIGEQFENNDFDFSAAMGVGLDIPFGLRIDARYNLGLSDIYDGRDGKNSVFSIAVGYSFL